MKSINNTICFLLGSLCVLMSTSDASFIPVGQPEYQFLYDAARRADILTGDYRLEHAVAPYSLENLGVSNGITSFFADSSFGRIRPFLFLSEDLSSARYSRSSGYESVRGGVTGSPCDMLSFYANFRLDEKLAKDPAYGGKKWRGLAGEVENAFIAFSDRRFDIFLGRFGANWGVANQSLILSSTARPMDAVAFRFHWGRFQFTYQLGQLDRLKATDSTAAFENRYFAGHRLDFRISHSLNIGMFETIIFGGIGRNIELAYLNPLMFYHSRQLNESTDDNSLVGLDAAYFIARRHKIYGQLLVDDFQIEKKSAGDKKPNQVGFLLGFQSINFLHLVDLQGQYLRIANRVYNQRLPRNRYENQGELIGNSFGPDGEKWSLSFARWFGSERQLALNFAFQRQGQGSFNDLWTEPWLVSPGDYSEPFPTGTVERKLSGYITADGFISSMAYVELTAGLDLYRNFTHISGLNRTSPFVKVRLTLILSTLLDAE